MKNSHWFLFICLIASFMFLFMDSLAYIIPYHEQQELFLFSRSYQESYLYESGGLGRYMANFITQFFYYPYVGKVIFTLLLSFLPACYGYVRYGNGGRREKSFSRYYYLLFIFFPA